MLPNFIVIGAAKSGTTSLYHYLRSHPQVFMPPVKELSFFVEEKNWSLGLDWYEKQFEGGENAVAVGEASPRYTMHPVYGGVPRRIFQSLPHARLIYLVRHPIERMRSHYLDRVGYRAEHEPIEKALLTNPIYLNASRYALQIEQYLEHFAREQLLVLTAEELYNRREHALRRIFGFLGVDGSWSDPLFGQEFHRTAEKRVRRPIFRTASKLEAYRAIRRLAPRPLKRLLRPILRRRLDGDGASIPEELRLHLTAVLREDVTRLRRYLDDHFDGWGIDAG